MQSLPDVKNYRAPRGPWRLILWAAIAVAFLTFVGPTDFAAELDVEAEAKILRSARAATIHTTQERKATR